MLLHFCGLLSWVELAYSCFSLSDCSSAENTPQPVSSNCAVSGSVGVVNKGGDEQEVHVPQLINLQRKI